MEFILASSATKIANSFGLNKCKFLKFSFTMSIIRLISKLSHNLSKNIYKLIVSFYPSVARIIKSLFFNSCV